MCVRVASIEILDALFVTRIIFKKLIIVYGICSLLFFEQVLNRHIKNRITVICDNIYTYLFQSYFLEVFGNDSDKTELSLVHANFKDILFLL